MSPNGFYWTFILLFWSWLAGAQDVHFSQLHRAPLHLNPAAAGTTPADYRFGGIYRSQWQAVPVPYTTYLAYADGRFALGPGSLGAGLQLMTDEAGDGRMRWVQGAVSLAYRLPMGDYFALSAGVQGSFAQRVYQWSGLTFDEQFDGDQFNPALISGEDLATNTLSMGSMAAGALLQFSIPDTRTRFDLGLGIHHLQRPRSSYFQTDSIRLSRRWSPHLAGVVQVRSRLDITVRAWWQGQAPYEQWVAGAGLIYHLQTARDQELSLELVLLGRLGDALIPQLALRYRMWEAGFSYDVNMSDFQKATNRRGGPEFYLQYFLTRVQAPPVFKACPIF